MYQQAPLLPRHHGGRGSQYGDPGSARLGQYGDTGSTRVGQYGGGGDSGSAQSQAGGGGRQSYSRFLDTSHLLAGAGAWGRELVGNTNPGGGQYAVYDMRSLAGAHKHTLHDMLDLIPIDYIYLHDSAVAV